MIQKSFLTCPTISPGQASNPAPSRRSCPAYFRLRYSSVVQEPKAEVNHADLRLPAAAPVTHHGPHSIHPGCRFRRQARTGNIAQWFHTSGSASTLKDYQNQGFVNSHQIRTCKTWILFTWRSGVSGISGLFASIRGWRCGRREASGGWMAHLSGEGRAGLGGRVRRAWRNGHWSPE